jgi:hypothetical protein
MSSSFFLLLVLLRLHLLRGESRWRSPYSGWTAVGLSGFRNSTIAPDFFPLKNIQDKRRGAHTVPYDMGAKGSFP